MAADGGDGGHVEQLAGVGAAVAAAAGTLEAAGFVVEGRDTHQRGQEFVDQPQGCAGVECRGAVEFLA